MAGILIIRQINIEVVITAIIGSPGCNQTAIVRIELFECNVVNIPT